MNFLWELYFGNCFIIQHLLSSKAFQDPLSHKCNGADFTCNTANTTCVLSSRLLMTTLYTGSSIWLFTCGFLPYLAYWQLFPNFGFKNLVIEKQLRLL